ncbi:hypothetical protein ACFFP0_23770 [Rhizobium puerariae]|uniref:Uncharacterized protein n=1 Tax=Rhizobium puerariae TaxID=1585791 RepID=A0ABV6ARE5_9HYPH
MADRDNQAPADGEAGSTSPAKRRSGLGARFRQLGRTIGALAGVARKTPVAAEVSRPASPERMPADREPSGPVAPAAASKREPKRQSPEAVVAGMVASEAKQHEAMRERLKAFQQRTAAEVAVGQAMGPAAPGNTVGHPAQERRGERRIPSRAGGQPAKAGPDEKSKIEEHRRDALYRLEGKPAPGRATAAQSQKTGAEVSQSRWSESTIASSSGSDRSSLGSRSSRSSRSDTNSIDTHMTEPDKAPAEVTGVAKVVKVGAYRGAKVVKIDGKKPAGSSRPAPAGKEAAQAGARAGIEKPAHRESLSELALSGRGYDHRPVSRGR